MNMPSNLGTLLDPLRAGWMRAARLFDARAQRERLVLSAAAAAVLLLLAQQLWLEPAWRAWSQTRLQLQQAEVTLQQLQAQADQLDQQQQQHTRQLLAELASLRSRVERGDLHTDARRQGLIGPTEMVPLLEQLLSRHSSLRVRSLQSLGQSVLGAPAATSAVPAASAASAAAGSIDPVIYRHGVELSIVGSYADLVAYLQALEALPQQLLWGSLQLKVEQYPQVVLTVRLHTLSLDSAWVEL